jgi:hypothetical protein
MRRPTHTRSSATAALATVTLLVITSHVSLIWHHAVPDFDTDTHIPLPCENPWIRAGMGDSAHPMGNALLKKWACQFRDSTLLTPAEGWYVLMSVAVVVVVALLLVSARVTGGGAAQAAVAVGYLGASPALRTLSNRAEEDWIGSALLLSTTLCIVATHRTRARWLPWLLATALCTVVLGLWHTQYLVVLAVGLVPWGVVALVRPRIAGTTRARAVAMGVAMLVPTGTVLSVLFASGHVMRADYHRMFFSIFNPDYWKGPVQWVRDYVAYSSRWLTGWLGNDGMEEKLFAAPEGAGFVLLGLLGLALVVALAVLTRDSLLIAITFGCLALPFLYEPHNAERWSPTSAMVALLLAAVAARPARPAVAGASPT